MHALPGFEALLEAIAHSDTARDTPACVRPQDGTDASAGAQEEHRIKDAGRRPQNLTSAVHVCLLPRAPVCSLLVRLLPPADLFLRRKTAESQLLIFICSWSNIIRLPFLAREGTGSVMRQACWYAEIRYTLHPLREPGLATPLQPSLRRLQSHSIFFPFCVPLCTCPRERQPLHSTACAPQITMQPCVWQVVRTLCCRTTTSAPWRTLKSQA